MARTPTALLSPADQERRRALRTMKGVALGALLLMALLFVVAFALQETYPWMAYVRAFAEGGMVGALADWFAVTALFRHPLGIPIPHTAIIPNRKDEIGRTLGEFVETNFLSGEIVRTKLEATHIAARLGAWLSEPVHAERVASEGSAMVAGVLRALSDDDVREVIEDLAREHLIEPEWGPPVGAWLTRIIDSGAHHGAVDLAVDSILNWLETNYASFEGLVSRRLPAWVPRMAARLVDDTVYKEAVTFVRAMQADPQHAARLALDDYLNRLADNLQHDPETIGKLEDAKTRSLRQPARARTRGRGVEHRQDGPAQGARRPGELAEGEGADGAHGGRRAPDDGCLAAGARRHLGDQRRGLPGRPLPPRHREHHHRDRRALGPGRDHGEDRADGRARPAVHPPERHDSSAPSRGSPSSRSPTRCSAEMFGDRSAAAH